MIPTTHPPLNLSTPYWYLLLLATLLFGCQTEPPVRSQQVVPEPSPSQPALPESEIIPTATVVEVIIETIEVALPPPEPAPESDHLVVCLTQEPVSLYPYMEDQTAALPIHHAIFENNITRLNYGYQAQGIEKLPSLADGDARLEMVTVAAGDRVVDAVGRAVELDFGVELFNAAGEIVAFAGEPVIMEHLVVDFTLKPRVWSDGRAVTAVDSVYSFDLASAADTAADDHLLQRTASYQATGRLGLRWSGLPGFYDDTYFLNLWQPLPRHIWYELSAADLSKADIVNRTPVGDGPFMVEAWLPGNRLELRRNPAYYRTDEGLPLSERVTFRFLPQAEQLLDELLGGDCDIVPQHSVLLSQATLLLEAEAGGLLVPYFQAGTIYEHIGFGINSYGGYGDDIGRPDWFEDEQVRQAMVMCTNRQAMVDQLLFGRSFTLNSYVPDSHPLAPPDMAVWPYDPDRGNELLDELGYESGRDGIRRYPGGPNGEFIGEPFRVRLLTTQGNEMRQRLTQLFQENMLDCGIRVERHSLPASELFADGAVGDGSTGDEAAGGGAAGPVFGRRFDLVAFGWPIDHDLACNLFLSDNVPGPADEINPDHYRGAATFGGWLGNNYTGWINEAFDNACWQTMAELPETAVYNNSHQQAITIFARELPIIPLFPRLSVAVARPEVINFNLDVTQPSELYNLYEIGLQP
jgi:peptide/nickel transport system substrate-binding protein